MITCDTYLVAGPYRIPADNRDLNYGKYFVEGEQRVSQAEDYNSHNTVRLSIAQLPCLTMLVRKPICVMNMPEEAHRCGRPWCWTSD